jgi:hypothetical protein
LANRVNEEANRFLLSLINLDEWKAANWMATGFVAAIGSPLPPFLVIVFANADPARALFAGLRSKVGQDDEEDLLRVSIVEGTFLGNPHSYAVNIGPDIGNVMKHFEVELPEAGYIDFLALSRVNRMNPNGPSEHLALFKEQFRRTGSYFLMPGYSRGGSLGPIDGLKIKKCWIWIPSYFSGHPRHAENVVPMAQAS